MKHVYPSYYKKFKCIADKCPDSCCKDWDIVVDDFSKELYNTVDGKIGERLRTKMTVDEDGDTVFISQNGRCPFWNNSGLCDIITELGENFLCDTCREFPRLTLDYTVFCEHMLSFACPEAARLILSEENAYEDFCNYGNDFKNSGYSSQNMLLLINARKSLAEILNNDSLPFQESIDLCFSFCYKIQKQLEESIKPYKFNTKEIFEMHKHFEFLTEEWREIIYNSADICEDVEIGTEYDREFKNLSLYYLYRYFLTAIDSLNVFSTLNRILCAYTVIGTALKLGYNFETLARLYSKEVEHSSENTAFLSLT